MNSDRDDRHGTLRFDRPDHPHDFFNGNVRGPFRRPGHKMIRGYNDQIEIINAPAMKQIGQSVDRGALDGNVFVTGITESYFGKIV
jgi:hypothetical protein